MNNTSLTYDEALNGDKQLAYNNIRTYLETSETYGHTLNKDNFVQQMLLMSNNESAKSISKMTDEEKYAYTTEIKRYIHDQAIILYEKSLAEHPREIDNKKVNSEKLLKIVSKSKNSRAYSQNIQVLENLMRELRDSGKYTNEDGTVNKEEIIKKLRKKIDQITNKEKDPEVKEFLNAVLPKKIIVYTESRLNQYNAEHKKGSSEETEKPTPDSTPSSTTPNDKKSESSNKKNKDSPTSVSTGKPAPVKGKIKNPKKKNKINKIQDLSTFADTYQTFSGHDILCSINMTLADGSTYTQTLGELQTITYSIHQEKYPIRNLGNMNAKGYVFGPRTIAGTLIFSVFNKHWSNELRQKYADSRKISKVHTLADEMPPFNIILSYVNEYGKKAYMCIYDVTLLNEGQVMSVNDMYIENTYQFYALNIDYLESLENEIKSEDSGKIAAEDKNTPSSTSSEPENKDKKDSEYINNVDDKKQEKKETTTSEDKSKEDMFKDFGNMTYEEINKILKENTEEQMKDIEKAIKNGKISEAQANILIENLKKRTQSILESAKKTTKKNAETVIKDALNSDKKDEEKKELNPNTWNGTIYEGMTQEEINKLKTEMQKQSLI